MNVFDMHITLQQVLDRYPELHADSNKLHVTRALIYTKGSLEAVDFLTDAKKHDIIAVYKMLRELNIIGQSAIPVPEQKTAKQRSFKRIDMVNFLKEKLSEQHPSIEFIQLKYNVLTCKLGERQIKIYISSSRDYEPLKDENEYHPNRISSWHKGERTIFTNNEYNYFAFLTKVDADSKYSAPPHGIEGMLLSFDQVQEWLGLKAMAKHQMINCYVHYTQAPDANGRTVVVDTREVPHLDITHWYNQPFDLIH